MLFLDVRLQRIRPQVSVTKVVLLPQEVSQIAEVGKLDDDVDRAVLCAHPQQVDNVLVLADRLHQVHFGHEVNHVVVRVAFFQHLHGHGRAGQLAGQEGLCFDDLSELALSQRLPEDQLRPGPFPGGIKWQLVLGDVRHDRVVRTQTRSGSNTIK